LLRGPGSDKLGPRLKKEGKHMNKFYWCYITNITSAYYDDYGYWCKIMADTPKQAYKTCKILGYKISKIKKAYGFWNRLNKDNSIKD